MSFKRELNDSLKSFKVRFFNVKTAKKKPEESNVKAKPPGEAMPKGKRPDEANPEQPAAPTVADLRAEQKAMKPMGGRFLRLTPKPPRLK